MQVYSYFLIKTQSVCLRLFYFIFFLFLKEGPLFDYVGDRVEAGWPSCEWHEVPWPLSLLLL